MYRDHTNLGSGKRDIPVYWDHINRPLIFDGVNMTNLVEIHEFKKLSDIQIISITELKMTDRAACKYNESTLRLNTRLLNLDLE